MLTLVFSSYFFALGLWSAKGFEIWNRHQTLKKEISVLNEMSQEQKKNLDDIMATLQKDPEMDGLRKHLLAVSQLTPTYTLDNALVKIEENQKLFAFTENLVFALGTIIEGGDEGVSLSNLQKLNYQIQEQQKKVQQALFIN